MTIEQIITAKEKDLGGFTVRRLLPHAKRRMVGPWIFFDHAGPVSYQPGEGIDVRPHPHINLATVTYLFEGEILHRDSLGNCQTIRPGDINLMIAGSGITHSERETVDVRNSSHNLHALQLWHALPETDEETDPSFHHYPAGDLPEFSQQKARVRLMMGHAYGFTSPVKTFAETLYAEVDLKTGDSLTLPQTEQLAIYVVTGSIQAEGKEIAQYSMAVLEDNTTLTIQAHNDARIAVIGGKKIGRRYIDWNFVSSRKKRIEQAREDWRKGRFAKVPGDENEFIPLPEQNISID